MKFDPQKEHCEERLSIGDFLISYNADLPARFPQASVPVLKEFKKTHPGLFGADDTWSLGQHRKKFMDWLPQQKISQKS